MLKILLLATAFFAAQSASEERHGYLQSDLLVFVGEDPVPFTLTYEDCVFTGQATAIKDHEIQLSIASRLCGDESSQLDIVITKDSKAVYRRRDGQYVNYIDAGTKVTF